MLNEEKICVSVIVPVFNTSLRYLKRCVESLSRQTLEELEIIFVDDGSGRTTAEYLDKLTDMDDRIKIIHKKNGGVSSARNRGLEIAKGEYVGFLDSDDWVDKNYFEHLYRAAENFEAEIVCSGYCKEYVKKTELVLMAECEYQVFSKIDEPEMMEFNAYDMRTMGFSTMKIYKRESIGDNRFNEELTNGEDVEFNFRVYKDIKLALYINKPYYHYRILEGSAVRAFDFAAIEKYTKTLSCINNTVMNKKDNSTDAYLDFVAISYIVLCMNNISSKNTKFAESMKSLKVLSSTEPFKQAVANATKLKLPLSRKLALICANYNFYGGVAFIIKTKKFLDRIHS